jgi:hypothetical protein
MTPISIVMLAVWKGNPRARSNPKIKSNKADMIKPAKQRALGICGLHVEFGIRRWHDLGAVLRLYLLF